MGLSTRHLACAALVAFTIQGCRGPSAKRARDPEAIGTPVVRAEPVREANRPPADGRLTPAQIELYLKVWASIAPAPAPVPGKTGTPATFPERARGLGDAVDGVAPDIASARAMKASVEEYLWVKERVLEAEAARMTARMNADVLGMLERTIADLKASRAKAPDEGSKTLLAEQIVNFEAEAARTRREAREVEPDTVRANLQILAPYRARLDAMQDQIDSVLPAAGGAPRVRRVPAPKKRAP
ncbi:MAG: hypothetical protein ABIQ65_12085 [Thermoanaerobaculia bacterium]